MLRALQLARRAQRRRALRASISALGPSLAIASGVALLAVLTDRLFGPGIEQWWMWMLLPALAVGLIVGVAIGFARRGSELSAASEVDGALALKDRIASALWFASAQRDDPFAMLAREEGERAAEKINLTGAMPIRLGRAWRIWPLLLAAAICAGLLLPPLQLFRSPGPAALTPEQIAAQQQATLAIEEALQRVDEPTPTTSPVADLAPTGRARDLLDKIRKELDSGATSPDEALSRAAGALDQMAAESRAASESLQAQSDASKAALSSIPSAGELGAPGADSQDLAPANSRLSKALRSGDLEATQRALEELREQIAALPPENREEAADDLESLAGALDEASKAAEQRARDATRDEARRLQEQGLAESEAAELARSPQSQQELERSLRDRGIDEDTARRLAERMKEQERRQAAEEQAAEDARRLAEAARQAAEDVRTPPPPTSQTPEPQQPSPQQPRDPADSTSEQRDADSQSQQQQQQQNQQQQREPGSPPSGPNGEQTPQKQPSSSDSQQQQQQQQQQQPDGAADPNASPSQQQQQQGPQPQPDQQGQGQSPQPTPSENQQQREGVPDAAQRQPPEQSGDPGAEPGEQSQRQQPKNGQQTQQQPGGSPPPDGAEPGQCDNPDAPSVPDLSPRGLEAMKEALKRMQERDKQAGRESQRARDLERQAREMLEKMSPEERERLQRWAAENMRESGDNRPPQQSPSSGQQPPQPTPGAPTPGPSPKPGASGDTPGSASAPVGSTGPGTDPRPTTTVPMDIRRSGENPRVAGEWTRPDDPDNPAARNSGPISTREMEDLLRDAQKSADQAVEDQVIPPRYRNVAEYFRKALERAEKEKARDAEQTPPPPPAPAAKDVDTKKP